MTQSENNHTGNDLLAALKDDEWLRIRPDLEAVELKQGAVMTHAEEALHHIYFPTSGIISSVADFEDGSTVETAQIGMDGLVDVSAVLGSRKSISRHVVQIAGAALRTEAATFRSWQQEMPRVQGLFLRYAQAFLVQAMQTAACNAIHSVQDRAARRLLMCEDISGQEQIALTQQSVGEMLGTSRSSVSTVARNFQHAGLIRYNRGTISIVNREGLMRASCECYHTIREHSARHATHHGASHMLNDN